MNQDYNNINQGNNGVPNNQPLNNNLNNIYNQQLNSNNLYNQQPNTQQSQNNINYNNEYQQPIQYQPNTQPVQNNYNTNIQSNNTPKKKFNMWLIIGIIISVIVIIFGIIIIPKLFNNINNSNNFLTNENSDVIIVSDKEDNKALFNTDGKQLTEFYDEIYNFYNGIAVVKNNNEYAVINSKGKFVINFKEYKSITSAGFLIKAMDNEYNYYLLNKEGKKIKELKDGEILGYFGYHKLIIISYDNYYEILNPYTGNLIKKIPTAKDAGELKVFDTNYSLTSFQYNNKTYIINYETGKVVNELTGEKQINSISNLDNTKYVINEKDSDVFEYYNNNKQIFITKECTNLFFEYNNNNLICAEGYGNRFLIDNNGKKTIEIYKSNTAYLDSKNYAINKNNSTTFYVDGKKVKEIKDSKSVFMISRSNKIYEVKTNINNKYKYQLYNFKGELISNNYFTNVLGFDKTNLAIASSNNKDFYLVDIKGNKVSEEYDSIRFSKPLYVAQKDKIYYILDLNGKQIMEKECYSSDIKIYENFFTIYENKKLMYYTLTGKNFYTINY